MKRQITINGNLDVVICVYHFVPSTDENGNSPGVFALLDDQHVILCGAKGDLLYHTSCAKLFWCQLTEPWHNAASCGYGNQLQGEKKKEVFDTTMLISSAQQQHAAIICEYMKW